MKKVILCCVIVFQIVLCSILLRSKQNKIVFKQKEQKGYRLFGGWQDYRLADMVTDFKHHYTGTGKDYHLDKFPTSIASTYIQSTTKECDLETLDKLTKINSDTLAVVHLRIGDVLDLQGLPDVQTFLDSPTSWTNGLYYVPTLNEWKDKILKLKEIGIERVEIVASSHVNYSSYPKSSVYIDAIANLFEKHGFKTSKRLGNNPDEDFKHMASSKTFVQAKGGYSKLIGSLVKYRGNTVI